MSNIDEFPLVSQMSDDRTEIEEFVLETTKGTKRMKELFYERASNQRNDLVQEKIGYYEYFSSLIVDEMRNRLNILMPSDCSDSYDKMEEDVSNYLSLVQLNSNSSPSFKLGLDVIVSSINELTSLEELNKIIHSFVIQFEKYGIYLDDIDFSYTMFTEMYMSTFLSNSSYESLKDTFEKIYFMCPDIKLQLKMNLEYLIRKYDSTLKNAVASLNEKLRNEYSVPKDENVVERYTSERLQLGKQKANDEYYNTMEFLEGKRKIQDYLEGSSTRTKIYNQFAVNGDYASYSDQEKRDFDEAMMGLFLTLNELKKFYHYEPLLAELTGYYKEKNQAKNSYFAKKKEIAKEESKRESIYKQYCKSLKGGLFRKIDTDKQKAFMLEMNNQIKKLHGLYEEEKELEIRYYVSFLKNTASIYDIFLVAFQSFPLLEKIFSREDYQELSLKENIMDLLRFVYNPNNQFLRNINGLTEYNLSEIVAKKYRLLNVVITVDMIAKEMIDVTLSDAAFINFVENVESSKISLPTISHICEMNQIIKSIEEK